jgi:hypothetical protein
MNKLHKSRQPIFLNFKYMLPILIFLVSSFLLFNAFTSAVAAKKQTFEAESAKLIGGASKVADKEASGGYLVSLNKPEDGITFSGLPAAGKLAIRYASLGVGVVNVAVNNQPIQKINVHSTGNLTSSFLNAIIEVAIPANARSDH